MAMKSTSKIWLGVGLFVTGAAAAAPPAAANDLQRDHGLLTAQPSAHPQWILMQHNAHGSEGGEAGEAGVPADLPPDFQFALTLALIRGHLLVGDELVNAGQWDGALPHFLHPTEELYDGIKEKVTNYNTPPFADALLKLADVVKAKRSADYPAAVAAVASALAAGDAGLKAREADWPSFMVATAVMALKSAAGEYGEAIVKGRIAKPVEYQDSRGFVWHAEQMIESVAPELERKDPSALKSLRASFAQLKKIWPSPMPPKTPVKTAAAMAADVTAIQRSAAKLM
ncbi:MAG: hypothetical protein C5B56_12690 [Proteobacteria bacterium]|nr:MAG: hypothetical protein C5B56_12690 [Pseudomonadota bacterium]